MIAEHYLDLFRLCDYFFAFTKVLFIKYQYSLLFFYSNSEYDSSVIVKSKNVEKILQNFFFVHSHFSARSCFHFFKSYLMSTYLLVEESFLHVDYAFVYKMLVSDLDCHEIENIDSSMIDFMFQNLVRSTFFQISYINNRRTIFIEKIFRFFVKFISFTI